MDREAWWTIVYGVARSQIRLSYYLNKHGNQCYEHTNFSIFLVRVNLVGVAMEWSKSSRYGGDTFRMGQFSLQREHEHAMKLSTAFAWGSGQRCWWKTLETPSWILGSHLGSSRPAETKPVSLEGNPHSLWSEVSLTWDFMGMCGSLHLFPGWGWLKLAVSILRALHHIIHL